MFGKIFGRRGGGGDAQALALQRDVYQKTLNHFSQFDERVSGLDDLAASFSEVWEEPGEVTQLKKDCAAIRELLSVIGNRLEIATSPLPLIGEPLTNVLDRIDSGEIVLQNLVVMLISKQAMLKAEKQSHDDAPD